jgi:hypothetical protein
VSRDEKRLVEPEVLVVMAIAGVAIIAYFAMILFAKSDVVEDPALQFVSGTEYNIGEEGQVIVEARFGNGTSALQGCEMSIWYPDKTVFIIENATAGANGNEYVVFTVPNVTGVYEYQADCTLTTNKRGIVSKSFHVSSFQNDTSVKLNRVQAVIIK